MRQARHCNPVESVVPFILTHWIRSALRGEKLTGAFFVALMLETVHRVVNVRLGLRRQSVKVETTLNRNMKWNYMDLLVLFHVLSIKYNFVVINISVIVAMNSGTTESAGCLAQLFVNSLTNLLCSLELKQIQYSWSTELPWVASFIMSQKTCEISSPTPWSRWLSSSRPGHFDVTSKPSVRST